MLRNRVFNNLIAIALIVTVALTTREAFATTEVVSYVNAAHGFTTSACATLPSHLSLPTEYVSEKGMWVTHTAQGPSGVDGGLMDLLSSHPTCSR